MKSKAGAWHVLTADDHEHSLSNRPLSPSPSYRGETEGRKGCMAKVMAQRQYGSNAYDLNLDALPPTHGPQKSLPLPSASSSAKWGCKDSSQLHGNCVPSHSKKKPVCSESQETKCPRWRAGPEGCHWLDSASSLDADHSHLSSLSLTLGACSGTGWPRPMTISLPGSSPSGHMLA